ncbi:hypothetical protein B7O87_05085 [Cylindrospermopsis raciborskii CENA303]|uniref:GUN4-like domain-containing protein n=2 Tax=Cylindrospermopsis raciborskii TaxID=77022 RepID=A0A1X4G9U7_9CYAN|nr:hypothetical protein B7O87_05085 [Cylindrospermopsis raciborskii CENA303]
MQNNLGLTEEAARYGVESWAVVLDKMTPQQIQQPIIKPPTTISRNQQPIVESTHPKPTEISQARQIDYTNLESLLQAQNFRAADEETCQVMLAVANREREGWLRTEDVEKFPCKELSSIDQLWVKYSKGKFGISVQQQIYQSLKMDKNNRDVWRSMGERVGWGWRGGWLGRTNWLDYNNFNFSQTAPSGHLPVARGGWWGPGNWERERVFVVSLLSRHAECNT